MEIAHTDCKDRIEDSRADAETLFQSVREEALQLHNEDEIMIGKLEAVVESHSECLKKSRNVFEDHDELSGCTKAVQFHQIYFDF